MKTEMEYDTLIIGGGIAGLQAAIQLGRSLHQVIVADSGNGRSVVARNYRNILGYPDGVSGKALRSLGEQHARQVGVSFLHGEVTLLEKEATGSFLAFLQTKEQQEVQIRAKTILLSSGIKDPFPEIPGLDPCLGESLFICPDCDGYEIVNQPAVVIGSGTHAVQMAGILRYFTTEAITVINHTGVPIGTDDELILQKERIRIYNEPIRQIHQVRGQLFRVELASGKAVEVKKGFLAFPGAKVQTSLVRLFPVKRLENGHILADPRTKETSCKNIWAAGDVLAHSQQVTISMGDGSQAAIWIHKRLLDMQK